MSDEKTAPPEAVSEPTCDTSVTLSQKTYETRLKQEKIWKERALRSEGRNRAINRERDQLVACLARIFFGSHLVEVEPSPDKSAAENLLLHYCCVHLPDGRNLTWLIHQKHLRYFSGIPFAESDYDGHTPPQKLLTLEEISLDTVIEGLSLKIVSASK